MRHLAPFAALAAWLVFATPAAAALTETPRLTVVYDAILAAQFDRVDPLLKQTCPPAPPGACASLAAVALWWQIQLAPESTRLDARFSDAAAAAIAANEAWTIREPGRAEAWFYLAGSYGPLVQWRVLRGQRLAAAREGKKIKDALERALQLDPNLDDAYFGIGLYHYYADVAPAAAKFLRWMLMLPAGDRVKGLQEMLQARQRGVLVKGEADYQLHLIYLWYERAPTRALDLLRELDAKYPTNPLFIQRIAEVENDYLHDHPASAQAWQRLLDRALAGRVADAARSAEHARLSLATELDAIYETDRAIDLLKAAAEAAPDGLAPGDLARARLQLGMAYDRLGRHDLALKAYSAATATGGADQTTLARARELRRATPDPNTREAYRLSLEGWRSFERGALDAAAAAIERALALDPLDQVARYRYARILAARGDEARANTQLEQLIAARVAPAFVLASAYVEHARRLERAGNRARAIEDYRIAAEMIGGDTRARDDARDALKRLRAS